MASHATQQITATLHALLPSYTSPSGELPRPLIHLTQSLLHRSRSRVPNLRNGEEEAARAWCVAEIACQRLKGRLNLPRIESRPPCAPKVYKRLYTYLDGALAADGGAEGKGPAGSESPRTPSKNLPVRTLTPTKRGAELGMARSEGSRKKQKVTREGEAATVGPPAALALVMKDGIEDATGDALAPLIRGLCKALDVAAATPHVYVGVRTILDSTSTRSTDIPTLSGSKKRGGARRHMPLGETSPAISQDRIPALVITVLLAVFDKMKNVHDSGSPPVEEERAEARRKAVRQLVEINALSPKQAKSLDQGIDDLERTAQEEGWWSWEWFSDVPVVSSEARSNGLGDGESEDLEHIDQVDGIGGTMRPLEHDTASGIDGTGCLMQDRFDWLTEERKRDFERWKGDFLRRVEATEHEPQKQPREQRQDQRHEDQRTVHPSRSLASTILSSVRQSLFSRQLV